MNNSTAYQDLDSSQASGTIQIALYYLVIVLKVAINPTCALIALFAAFVNIMTFLKMDLTQGVNLSLFILSASYLFLAILLALGNVLKATLWLGLKNLAIVRLLLMGNRFGNFLNITAYVVTTTIAIFRCLSVAMPFKFSNLVTTRRQLVAIVMGCCVGFSVPIRTQILYYTAGTFSPVSTVNLYIMDTFRKVFFFSCLAIIIVSTLYLTVALRRSSRFQVTANTTTDSQSRTCKKKEVKVIKTVILVLTIFAACNVPLMLLSALRLASIDFTNSEQYQNANLLVKMIIELGASLNITLNTFVYLRYNTSFRAVVKKSLPCFFSSCSFT
ncbi:chemosensory receptor A [Elysia marginata]|uniref:Chemosensory receptor A n=1 Tax=Elysia marginata TaxID=1093978 RepID=A0AAV4JEZ7_9GAST|nr:chemosensory receptor A [Elysia marginata]